MFCNFYTDAMLLIFVQYEVLPVLFDIKILFHCAMKVHFTERHGREVNTPTSCSEGPGFDYRHHPPVILIEDFVVFLSPSRRIPA
jgi:hypothetical protein